MRSDAAEAFLIGRSLTPDVCQEAGRLAASDISPISDLRGSADYRLATVSALVADALDRLSNGTERDGWPAQPVLLETRPVAMTTPSESVQDAIQVVLNGEPRRLSGATSKTLLDALREDAGLTGNERGLRRGRVWRLHRLARWPGGDVLPGAGGPGARRGGDHDRGARRIREATNCILSSRRLSTVAPFSAASASRAC